MSYRYGELLVHRYPGFVEQMTRWPLFIALLAFAAAAAGMIWMQVTQHQTQKAVLSSVGLMLCGVLALSLALAR